MRLHAAPDTRAAALWAAGEYEALDGAARHRRRARPPEALVGPRAGMSDGLAEADVCLIVEGAYPYVVGGVSGWLQDLIENLPDVRFGVVAIKADDTPLPHRLTLPANVVGSPRSR
ncbi:DUF3492 domain-containing protein [Sphingomonas sp. MMS24-JH45]